MKILIIIMGIAFLLGWLVIYVKFFSGQEERKEYGTPKPGNEGDRILSVAPWGDDSNDGSYTSPWKTLQYGIKNLQSGDRLLVREGVYSEYVSFDKSGNSERPIFISAAPGEEVVLDGGGVGWKYGFNFEYGVSFIDFSGFKVKNFHGAGVALWGDNETIKLNNLEILGCGTGVHIISAVNLLIEDCYFHNNNGPGLVVSPGPLKTSRITRTRSSNNDSLELPDGFSLDNGEDIVFEKCMAEYNAGSGFNCSTANTTFTSCITRDNGYYGIKCMGSGYCLVNCIIDNNGMAGLALEGGEVYKLYNNLVVNCGIKGDYGMAAAPVVTPLPVRVALINNIFAFNYGGVYFGSTAVVEKEDYNIYWSRKDAEISTSNRKYSREEINEQVWFKETGQGKYSFCRDPLFVDLTCRDFRLAKNSPAIDRGTKDGAPDTDINGRARPQGRGFDIGPYEAIEGSIIPPNAKITYSPTYSSDNADSLHFTVKWAGYNESGVVEGFNVQVKEGSGGTWQNWLTDTKETESKFLGVNGHTYYFRVRAKDDLGNWGKWSDTMVTIVPLDDQSPLIKYEGNWDVTDFEGAFLNTLHYSITPGAVVSFRFASREIAWISTIGPDRGQALVYIDDKFQATVDLYNQVFQSRKPVFTTSLDANPHTIRIEVAQTKNEHSKGYRVDIDGIAIKL
ncbi:right-handed parallel beta-helix repeat-containing protein [Desulfotruncus alcoholivorax]|uniref:right-handed parallel beta-helix repeat-containing protein n=1 Tax=Desulfotruncus alcoholivorax TaxID=265477 RepID=UPI0004181D5D|nr:right-handed parallel beta-helix repeat-containing protein [Desulfotruncus alcoholivorax]